MGSRQVSGIPEKSLGEGREVVNLRWIRIPPQRGSISLRRKVCIQFRKPFFSVLYADSTSKIKR